MSHMQRALDLARRAVGSVSPNPAVGAVVVRDSAVIAEGHTQPPGGAHAEIEALRRARGRTAGAVLYTTLEPCAHHGRTPPCTQAIIHAGIAEVRSAVTDPNPRVNGAGFDLLREAGIAVHVGECEEQAREIIEAYARHVVTGMPFVTAKFAASLDGKIATATGESRWITSEQARAYAHELRAATDAIMVGIGTALADDPQLTARDARCNPRPRQPTRVVVDSEARLPPTARMLAEPGHTIVAVADAPTARCRALEQAGARVVHAPSSDGAVDLDALLTELGRNDTTSVLVEGGGTLHGSLFDAGLVDKVVAFIAPTIIGGAGAPSPVAGAGAQRIADAALLTRVRTLPLGRDVAIIGYCEE